MIIIRFCEPISIQFSKSAGSSTVLFEANRDYLVANTQHERMMRDPNINKIVYKVSRCDMRLPAFNAVGIQGRKKVLIYNGSGGYGDQVLTWPVLNVLSEKHDVHVLTEPGNNSCYWNLPFIKTVQTIPILWEQVRVFDYFVPWEYVVNLDEHQDQEHPTDTMLRQLGYDPAEIPAERKIVRPVFTPSEMGTLNKWYGNAKKVGLYQLAASNPVRSLTPSDSVFMAVRLAEAFPDMQWLCLYDVFNVPEYKKRLDDAITQKGLKNIQPFCAPNLRELWALTEHVGVVVSPDSMMVHIAGVYGTPCVGLWGPIDPARRVCYYKNHIAVQHREHCPHAPCFAYAAIFPRYCPPQPVARTSCDVLASIGPAEVITAVQQIRRQ